MTSDPTVDEMCKELRWSIWHGMNRNKKVCGYVSEERLDDCSDEAVAVIRPVLEDLLGRLSTVRAEIAKLKAPKPPPTCRGIEGATGIDCELPPGHAEDHEGTHTPREDGTESVGYPLFVRWPYTPWDSAAPAASVGSGTDLPDTEEKQQ
jgi:hypothetical protein